MRNLFAELELSSPMKAYTSTLLELMRNDERVMQIESDVGGEFLNRASKIEFPERSLDVGIMESNFVGMACGLSLNDKIPFLHAFGVFIARRTADQLFVSGCYNRANVKLFGSKPGILGQSDGTTHQAFEDMAIMRALPGMDVFDVADPVLMKKLMLLQKEKYGMSYTRIVRNNAYAYYLEDEEFEIGKMKQLRDGDDVTIIASGYEVVQALQAHEILLAEGIKARVMDCFSIKPLDCEGVIKCANETKAIVTAENHSIIGGLGSAVAEVLAENCPVPMQRIGVQDRFGQSGTLDFLLSEYGLDAESIADACRNVVRKKNV